jgi:pyruvate/2-oxoglutarate dehydrogenase complex dihydrolipoamide acyltransferase (E2) component
MDEELHIVFDQAASDDEVEVMHVAVAVGADVAKGELLIEIATDKADVEVSAPADGRITSLLVAAGDMVRPGQLVRRCRPPSARADCPAAGGAHHGSAAERL